MKILHTADIHYSRENQIPAMKSLNYLYEYGESQGVDLWVIAGDLFDRAVQNTASSGFPQLVEVLQKMMNIAPIVAVKGTPTHDIDGCYEALQEINAEYSLTVLNPDDVYLLSEDGQILVVPVSDPGARWAEKDKLLILGCPEPSKEWFLRDKQIGKDESTQAVIAGMQAMLLGWGAIRREYPEIPCLFVYHGQVAGATLQNNQILPAGDIAIGRDDLAQVGADYCALGHIHLAQHVSDLPAYYAGSAFPVTWGETDQKGFNSITFGDGIGFVGISPVGNTYPKIQRIPFPHPRRKKIVQVFGSTVQEGGEGEVDGFQTWLEIKASKTQASIINKDSLLTELLSWGALAGSRVTVSILPTETVRAGHITEAHKLRDKVGIYAENSGAAASEAVLELADSLEAAAMAQGLATVGLHLQLQKICLRGAIGIYKGLGLDQVEVNFEEIEPGVVTLVGVNGSGKTTLMEHMIPWPTMATRKGKLQDHFRLRDSYRDQYFIEDLSGDKYRAFIQIDGQNPSGACEYHLYKNGESITNGRKEDYIEKITALFGSFNLYLRSAFITQKPSKEHPDLSEATKGEKKALFGELGGTDYLQGYADQSRETAKVYETVIVRDQMKVESLTELVESGASKEDELTELVLVQDERVAERTKIKAASEELSISEGLLQAKVEANQRIRDKCHDIRNQLQKLLIERSEIDGQKDVYATALMHKPEMEKTIADHERLRKEEEVLSAERSGILEKREQITTEHRNATALVEAENRKCQAEEAKIRAEIAAKEKDKAQAVAKIDQIEEFLASKVRCPECGNEFSPGQEEYKKALEHWQPKVWEIDKELSRLNNAAFIVHDKIDHLVYLEDPPLPNLEEITAKLGVVKAVIVSLEDLSNARNLLQKAQEAEVRIEEGSKRDVVIMLEENGLNKDLSEAEALFDPNIEIIHNEAVLDLDESRDYWRKCNDEVIRLQTEVKNLEKQIEELGERRKELYELELQIADQQEQIADWRYLERACGPDGIQALELGAMGPGIAEVATKFLQIMCDGYPWDEEKRKGNPFNQIMFETIRIGGSGSKKKQIEDFLIFAYDTRDNTWTEISMISGGESVWVTRAIYDAFNIIRNRNTGQRIDPAMQDEADGALDADARIAYFRMLEAAHLESGRNHSIVITHSLEAQEMVAQRIVMSELGGEI